MSIFHKREKSQYNELTDNYRPAYLPSAGLSLETFATSDYSLNKPDFIQAQYQALEVPAKPVLDSTDKHSNGMEGYSFAADALPETDDLRAVDAEGLAALPMPTAMRAFREIAEKQLKNA